MKNFVKFTLFLMALVVTFNAQAQIDKSDLLGIWTQTENQQGVNVTSTYDFKDDGTVTQILVMNSLSPRMNVIADGTVKYTLSDDTLTFKFTSSDFNFSMFEIEGLPAEYVDMAKKQMIDQMANTEQKLTDLKIEGNTLTAKFQGHTITLQRQ